MVDRDKFSDYSKSVGFLDARIRVPAPSETTEPLPLDFEPGNWDVICQGGKDSYDHIGNRRFRVCIENNLQRYKQATSKHERSLVVTSIVDAIRDSRTSEQGGFVRKHVASGRWYEVGDKTAREKVGHALRDALKFKNREHSTCHSMESSDKEELKHPSKRRRTMLDGSMVPTDVNETTGVRTYLSPLRSVSESTSVSSTTLNKQQKENGHTIRSTSTAIVEAEWEISLKESTKQFQDSDDESDSIEFNFCRGALEQVSDKNPSPIHSSTHSFKPPGFVMMEDIGKNSTAVRDAGRNQASSWNPPGFSDFEDLFAQCMQGFGKMTEQQPMGMKGEASMSTPYPKPPIRQTIQGDYSRSNSAMSYGNHTPPSSSRFESNMICDSE